MEKTPHRLLHAACMSAAVLALCASVAAGSASLGIEPAGSYTATSEGRVTFQDAGGTFRVSCNLTLTGILGIGVNKAAARSLEEGQDGDPRVVRRNTRGRRGRKIPTRSGRTVSAALRLVPRDATEHNGGSTHDPSREARTRQQIPRNKMPIRR
jgi:hypothetical protein